MFIEPGVLASLRAAAVLLRVNEVSMGWSVYVTKLQSVLAVLFPLRDICVILCAEGGVDTARIDFDEPSYVRWFHIIDEALKQETFDSLLVAASAKYPQNRSLNQAMSDWVNHRDGSHAPLLAADVFQASVVRDLAAIDSRVAAVEASMMALAAGREAEIQAGTVAIEGVKNE